MSGSIHKIFEAREMAKLYDELKEQWLLLEIIEIDKNQRASKLKLLAHSFNKDELHDYLLEDETWDWDKKYIMVFSDPDKACDII